MGSGKSTLALQIRHNLSRRGLRGVLFTQLDRTSGMVSSRLGVSSEAYTVGPGLDLFAVVEAMMPIDFVVCDEAQFYEPAQIEQLARLVDELGVEVYAFGLLTSFQGKLFDATARLLELADQRQEIQVEARCWCGEPATHNARLHDGVQVYEGALKVVGDTETPEEAAQSRLDLEGEVTVTYELLCRRHWLAGDTGPDSAADEIPNETDSMTNPATES